MFTLEPNTAKNMYFMKKSFKKKLFVIKFLPKKSASAYVYLPHKWSQGAPKISMFEIL